MSDVPYYPHGRWYIATKDEVSPTQDGFTQDVLPTWRISIQLYRMKALFKDNYQIPGEITVLDKTLLFSLPCCFMMNYTELA